MRQGAWRRKAPGQAAGLYPGLDDGPGSQSAAPVPRCSRCAHDLLGQGLRHRSRGPHGAAEGARCPGRRRRPRGDPPRSAGRSLRDVANVAHEIEAAGANLKVIEQSVDTSTAAGRAFFGMLAVFAVFETDVRRERQLEGIALAKRQGVYTGGKARLDRARVKQLANGGLGHAKIARELGMARSSV